MTRTIPLIIGLAIAAVFTIVLCTFIGPAGFGFVTTAPGAADIVGGIRLPRVLSAFFVGGSLFDSLNDLPNRSLRMVFLFRCR
ncbi:MAG: hypothetical protein A4E36_00145 [Methanoregulaceae archaeon PtaB.Bin009]|nr:MAG: hypothetical protein A4E36_00145 [Methanoregulaceae archaeon PtaB.Bin009]